MVNVIRTKEEIKLWMLEEIRKREIEIDWFRQALIELKENKQS